MSMPYKVVSTTYADTYTFTQEFGRGKRNGVQPQEDVEVCAHSICQRYCCIIRTEPKDQDLLGEILIGPNEL
jgi:hypothetical protein